LVTNIWKDKNKPGNDQIPEEMIQAGGNTSRSVIHKLFNYVWNNEELPQQWKEFILILIYKKGDKTDCSNYRGISLLATTYSILYNILDCFNPVRVRKYWRSPVWILT
jgi:hypothetical protein